MHITEFSISFEKLQILSESMQNESLAKNTLKIFKTETKILKVKAMIEIKMMISVKTMIVCEVRISVRLIETVTVFVTEAFKFSES